MKTPEQILSNRSLFCDLLNDARIYGFPGCWEGSAFRSHPCGIKRGVIKMTNNWHVDDLCSIAITDGEGWSDDYCRESCAYGDAHPKPINGKAISVWCSGKWQSEEARVVLEPVVLRIIAEAIDFIESAKTAKREKEAYSAEERKRLAEASISAALTKAVA